MSFAHAWVLVFLVLVPAGLALWLAGLRRGQVRARSLSRTAPAGYGRAYAGAVLVSLAAALAIVAAAQPRWGTTESSVPREGAELVVVMDVSRSMGATDVAPSRLAATKDAVAATLARLGGDRVGLVVFAGDARLRFPLTTDFRAAEQVVRSLETGTVIVEGGSSAAQGLQVALDAFDLDKTTGRLVVVLTDGDDLGDDPGGAAERLRQAGIGLLVVGVGTPEGAPVPVYDPREQGFVDKLDENGEPIISRLDEPFLRALAEAADGQYLGGNLGSVPGAVEGRIRALERAEIDRQSTETPVER
ncbi:MAG: VWA domain-containing protein, partial [Dehalococcoidia bacterium]|nr:VWA domain-containing protein [Dehalococcoidia bacterium]